MAELIRLPKMSDTMEEGVIVKWNVKVGDTVKTGDILADVETDKATMELENFVKGTILQLKAKEGEATPVDSVIAIIGQEGEDYSALLNGAATPEAKPVESSKKETAPIAETKIAEVSQPVLNTSDDRIKASPLAKKLAEDNRGKVRYFYTGSGANNTGAKNALINTLNFYKANDNNDHMATNKDAVSDLLNKI